MIRTIIIDDESHPRDYLEKLLLRYFPNKFIILAKCSSVDEAILMIDKYNPELVFLDIQMHEKDGFELLKLLPKIDFEIIFTTAHPNYAIEAIKWSALDYLLKPINHIELASALKRFDKKTESKFEFDKIKLLLSNLDSGDGIYSKVAFPLDSGYKLVKINSIIYCESDVNYTTVYLIDGTKFVLAKTLKKIEALLPKDIFIRVHKSYLLNINHIVHYDKNREQLIELINGSKIPVAIRKKNEVVSRIITKD
jgi:two-component system LytT family response regulator